MVLRVVDEPDTAGDIVVLTRCVSTVFRVHVLLGIVVLEGGNWRTRRSGYCV
jgi:hypothetical protein